MKVRTSVMLLPAAAVTLVYQAELNWFVNICARAAPTENTAMAAATDAMSARRVIAEPPSPSGPERRRGAPPANPAPRRRFGHEVRAPASAGAASPPADRPRGRR